MLNIISQIQDSPIFQTTFLSNSLFDWLFALVAFVIIVVLLKLAQVIIIFRLKRIVDHLKLETANMLAEAVRAIRWPFYAVVALYLVIDVLNTRAIIQQWVYYIFLLFSVYYVIKALTVLIDLGIEKLVLKKETTDIDKVKFLGGVVKVLLWVMAIILLLSNFGYDVTSLLAGLGIGGIAIAFAAQQILGDIIGAFTIYFDKPFRVGDNIEVGDFKGKVLKIGIKSVRMKASDGEEIIIANGDIAKARIKNFGKNI